MQPESFESYRKLINIEPSGTQREFLLYTLKKGQDMIASLFLAPASDKGRATLRLGDNMWLYIPNVGKPIRITSLQSVVGGVFNNADIMRLDYHVEYDVQQLEDLGPEYLLDLKAKTGAVAYDKLKMWVDKATVVPTKIECYAATGLLIKTLYFKERKPFDDGTMRPAVIETDSPLYKGYQVDHGLCQGAEAQLPGRGLYPRLSPEIGVHAMSCRVGGLLCLALLLLSSGLLWAQGDYEVDLSAIEKEIAQVAARPYSLGGFAAFTPTLFGLDRDAALYRLRFFDQDVSNPLTQYDLGLRPEVSYRLGIFSLFARADILGRHDYQGWDANARLFEGFGSLKPSPSLALEAGKKVVKWGKGYAWNPVAFVDRPKNPEDPEELEGFFMATGNVIHSFAGPLKTVAFNPVILPVYGHVNGDFGEPINAPRPQAVFSPLRY